MTVTVGINGFGRIGRSTLAHIAESARNDVQVVKINATGPGFHRAGGVDLNDLLIITCAFRNMSQC